jgi:hypothetical protein
MKRALALLLAGLAACGGDSEGNGPSDADVIGTWIVTFSSTTNCDLSQISFILSRSQSGGPLGDHGSYVISCVGVPDVQENPGSVTNWAVNGDRFSMQVSNQPARTLSGTVSGGTMAGTFAWLTMSGTFTATKQ